MSPLLVHVDCDTYAATVDVLELCAGYVEHGLVIHFDDYFGFPDWRNGGFKALQEIAEKQRWRLTYLSYGTKEAAVLAECCPRAKSIFCAGIDASLTLHENSLMRR